MTAYAASTRRPPRTMTGTEQALLLKVTGEHARGFRDHVIYSLALGTGLRESEIAALDVGDVTDARGKVKRRITLRVFKRCTDNPAPQEVFLPDSAYYKLGKLLRWKKDREESLKPDAPLFVSRQGGRLTTRMIRMAFQTWQKRAGFERIFSFHSVRHSAITNIYEATRDIRLAQRFARHKSITSTQIYTHPSDETLFRAVQELPC